MTSLKPDIAPVISAVVSLKRYGTRYQGKCPFHEDHTPSFSVYENTQKYYCHGCGEGGDVFDFVQKYYGVDFIGAKKFLGIAPTDRDTTKRLVKEQSRHKKLVEAKKVFDRWTAKYYQQCCLMLRVLRKTLIRHNKSLTDSQLQMICEMQAMYDYHADLLESDDVNTKYELYKCLKVKDM